MTHATVLKYFKEEFPHYFEDSTIWFPNGKNSIRVRLKDNRGDLVFTIDEKKNWMVETLGCHINRMNAERKLKKKGA